MKTSILIKTFVLGFLSWLIPFAVSFLFYKPDGTLLVPYATFKSAIMVVGILSGCYLLYRYFKLIDNRFIKHGIEAGLLWFALNILLDAVVLIPIMKTTFADYFMSIGLSYTGIPIISITMGYLLNHQSKKHEH